MIRNRSRVAAILTLVMLAAGACASPAGLKSMGTVPTAASPLPAGAATPVAAPATADPWVELHTRVPFPYSTSLPPEQPTPVDGTYVKTQPSMGEHIHCKRCPDYLPEGGVWKMSLARGVFRIYYPAIGWLTVASYAVDGDRLTIFNDPYCPYETGTYRWQRSDRQLVLVTIHDTCSTNLRGANLSSMPWDSCQPPNREAAVTDHWLKPVGCQ